MPPFLRPSFHHHVCTRDGIKSYVEDLSETMTQSHDYAAIEREDAEHALDQNANANGADHHRPTIFLLKEGLTDFECKELEKNCTDVQVKIVGEDDIQNDNDNAVIVHVRNICYGPGTGVKQSRLLKYPLHLLQVQRK